MYHCHTDYSLLDSCSKPQEFVDLAVRDGMKAISFSEHGKPLNWPEKWAACKAAGIRYIHSVEIYLTESLEEKVRDNYHTVLMARNFAGLLELNALVSKSCDEQHKYYVNRISFDEFLGISKNIISTSACLASPLNKLSPTHPRYMELAQKYDFLEVQGHHHPDQVAFNRRLLELSKQLGKPLIAGTDTHSSSPYKAECRSVLLTSKHKSYGDEDAFDLTYKTYDELVEMFRTQGALPEEAYMQAIENTNLLYDMTEDIELDTSIKYPILYGSRDADDKKFTELVERKFREKLDKGIIPMSQKDAFRAAIDEELRVLRKLGMTGFMLSMADIISWCRDSGMAVGTARGSVGGCRVAYITDIIDMNPETWGTLFSRFSNEDRVEPGDIDTDVVDTDRPAIFQHIIETFGSDKTARVASFGTMQGKGAIDDIGRYLAIKWEEAHGDPAKAHKLDRSDQSNPWNLQKIKQIKADFDVDETKTREKYPELFYYYDGLVDTKISQSVHPAGMVISPITLADNYGVFDKDGETCMFLDMDNAHLVGTVKYDMLVLKSVKVIRDACNYIGIPYPKTYQMDFDDPAVWDSLDKDLSMIFQMESAFAATCFKQFKPRNIFDMSLVTACIRPSGTSYRDALLSRKIHKNPTEEIDHLLEKNLGYLVYQEDVSKYLMEICGLSGSEADTVRRGIAKKKLDVLEAMMPKIISGYCARSTKPREVAEQEVREYLKVIEDASSYMFNYSHSVAYCLLGYYYGYFRYYYPHEFITAYLNNAANDEDIRVGTAYANKIGIAVTMPKWGVSKSDYAFDKERNIIAKGLASIKYLSAAVANELYRLAHSGKTYKHFVDLLLDLENYTSLDSRQLDILIKLDFFSEFGNQRELLRIVELFDGIFKSGEVKQIKKIAVDGTPLEPIIQKYSLGTTKSGAAAKSYTVLDVVSAMREAEYAVLAAGLPDLGDVAKVKNFYDTMGYAGYVSGKQEDRPKLYITDVFPVCRKKDGKQFGYNIRTKSIGSGKEACFTAFNAIYNQDPIKKGDVIRCQGFQRDGAYFTLTKYEHIYT